MPTESFNAPPFPPLQWDKYFWAGEVILPTWAGFQSRRGNYASVSSHAKSDGRVRLTVTPENDEEKTPPLMEQIRAFQLLLENERAVGESVLMAIFAEYPRLCDMYGYDDDEAAELMPKIKRADQLRTLIGLSNVHLLNVAKDGISYIGFEFGCTWDDEHGLGVMTYRNRVVEVGGADTSFLAWIAEADAETHE